MDELDRLLTRVIDRDDDAQDWHRLRELAAGNPQVWSALADGLEDDRVLRAALTTLEPTAGVSLPPPPRSRSLRRLAPWAAALILAALWLVEVPSPLRSPQPQASSPQALELATPPIDETLVGELPRIVVSTGDTAADGSVEVVYLRRILERARIRHVQTVRLDEMGVPFELEQPASILSSARSM